MEFSFEMFISDEENFRRELFGYTSKWCDASVLFVKDYDLSEFEFRTPYVIIKNKFARMFKNRELQNDITAYSITYGEWNGFEKLEIPHISYVSTVDPVYDDVLKIYMSVSAHVINDCEPGEDLDELNAIMKKYQNRYFTKAGRLKNKVYDFTKN